MKMNAQAIVKLIRIHFEEAKKINSTSNRMYLLGLISTAQFCNDDEINNIVHEVNKYLVSTLPEIFE